MYKDEEKTYVRNHFSLVVILREIACYVVCISINFCWLRTCFLEFVQQWPEVKRISTDFWMQLQATMTHPVKRPCEIKRPTSFRYGYCRNSKCFSKRRHIFWLTFIRTRFTYLCTYLHTVFEKGLRTARTEETWKMLQAVNF